MVRTMSAILPNTPQNRGQTTPNDAIFVENLEPWAAEQVASNYRWRKCSRRMLALMIERRDGDIVEISYRDFTKAECGTHANICKALKRMVDFGFVKKLHGKPPETGRYRILCLKGGAE